MQTIKHWKDIFKALKGEISLVLQILDARNPIGTHNTTIEQFIEENDLNLDVVLVLNKIDMIPRDIVDDWYKFFLKKGYRMFSTTAIYDGGVKKLKKFLRGLPKSKFNNVLIVGYPNTGKSCLIESLSKYKKKVGVSSKAGFTRSLMKVKIYDHVFLIDTPGVIPFNESDEVEMALKSCMMADKLDDPLSVVETIFSLIPINKFNEIYGLDLEEGMGVQDLVQKIGRKLNLLAKGGIIDTDRVIKKIIRDWQSNTLRYYIAPPSPDNEQDSEKISPNYISDDSESDENESPDKDWGLVPPSLGFKRKKNK